ncbi:MAG: HlyD family secretion protein [Cellvibrionaceae bacterium]|jgi:HlyD family secretion protein
MNWKLQLSVFFIALSFLACGQKRNDIALGTLEWDRLELSTPRAETVTASLVKVGDRVAAGQALLQLRGDSAKVDRAQLTAIQVDLAEARKNLGRMRKLIKTLVISQAELDVAESRVKRLQAQEQELIAELTIDLNGIEPVLSAEARAGEIDKLVIRAPTAGVIDALPFKVGERPNAGETVVVMLAGNKPYARIYVPQSHRNRLQIGQQLSIKIGDNPYKGSIRLLSNGPVFTPYYSLTQDERSHLAYLVELDIQESDLTTSLAGMPVTVSLP